MSNIENTKKTESTKAKPTESQKAKTQLANDVANAQHGINAKEFMEETVENINSINPAISGKALKAARDFTAELTLLMLYQDIQENTSSDKYEWVKFFRDETIAHGNSKQFVRTIKTGSDVYAENAFIPNKITSPIVEQKTLSMYEIDAQGQKKLTNSYTGSKAYQFKKPLTIQEPLWLPYFMSGKLGEFLDRIQSVMRDSYDDYIVALCQSFMTNIVFQKTITDTTNLNMFDAFANEILPNLKRIQYKNTEYNIAASSRYIDAPNKENLLVFINSKNETKLTAGIQSKLFNAKMISLESIIPLDNIIGTAGGLTVGDSDTPITVTSDWLDENTILVIEKDALRHCLQIDRNESQAWSENMTIQLNLHVWGVMGYLPWKKGFKYTNTNLKVIA
ncbi:MAG: hypothetical protein RSD51_03300 [Malacoplasma sp.]